MEVCQASHKSTPRRLLAKPPRCARWALTKTWRRQRRRKQPGFGLRLDRHKSAVRKAVCFSKLGEKKNVGKKSSSGGITHSSLMLFFCSPFGGGEIHFKYEFNSFSLFLEWICLLTQTPMIQTFLLEQIRDPIFRSRMSCPSIEYQRLIEAYSFLTGKTNGELQKFSEPKAAGHGKLCHAGASLCKSSHHT